MKWSDGSGPGLLIYIKQWCINMSELEVDTGA